MMKVHLKQSEMKWKKAWNTTSSLKPNRKNLLYLPRKHVDCWTKRIGSGWICSTWIMYFWIRCDYFIKSFNEKFFKYWSALFQELKVKVILPKALFTKQLMGFINVMTPLDRHPPHEERHFSGSAHHKVLPRGTHRSMLRSGFWCNLDPKKQNLTSVSTRNLLFVIFFVLSPETLLVIPKKACALSQGRCSHKSWRGPWDIMLSMNLIISPVPSISKHFLMLRKCLLFPWTFHLVRSRKKRTVFYRNLKFG